MLYGLCVYIRSFEIFLIKMTTNFVELHDMSAVRPNSVIMLVGGRMVGKSTLALALANEFGIHIERGLYEINEDATSPDNIRRFMNNDYAGDKMILMDAQVAHAAEHRSTVVEELSDICREIHQGIYPQRMWVVYMVHSMDAADAEIKSLADYIAFATRVSYRDVQFTQAFTTEAAFIDTVDHRFHQAHSFFTIDCRTKVCGTMRAILPV